MDATIEKNTENEYAKNESTYFSVSPIKLVVMSIGTFGVYDLYWFYKNFCYIKVKGDFNIMPFWRAFFAPLWSYSAFDHIQDELNERSISIKLYAGFFAVFYFIIQACWKLPDPYWLISFFSFLAIMPANHAATRINHSLNKGFTQNSQFKGWNWLAILVGWPFMILAIIGTFLPA